jgi:hypothetical protein
VTKGTARCVAKVCAKMRENVRRKNCGRRDFCNMEFQDMLQDRVQGRACVLRFAGACNVIFGGESQKGNMRLETGNWR